MKHIVEYSEIDKTLRIFRMDAYGEVLFTEVRLDMKPDLDFSMLANLLGENLLLDTPGIRKHFGF